MDKEQLKSILNYGPYGSHSPVRCPKCGQYTTHSSTHICTTYSEGTELGPMREE